MPLTLVESAKRSAVKGEVFSAAVAMQYAETSPILGVLPFETIMGNALRYNREEKLPGIGFRGINETYTESTGIYNPQVETLAIAGGYLDVDIALIRSFGSGIREQEETNKIRALSLAWTRQFFKGDASLEPRAFDGLQKRLTGTQLIAAGNTSGGDALSLATLDRLISRVRQPTHLVMSIEMSLRFSAATRNVNVGGFIQYTPDTFGRSVMSYQGLPILVIDEDNDAVPILPFTEANPGGGTPASTSIYCVSFGAGRLFGIQNMEISALDLGELQTKPAMRTRVEWEAGFAVYDGRAAARLWGIRDAAIVA